MPGSFQVVTEAVGSGMPGRPGHLYFAISPGAKPSKTELKLRNDCERVAAALRAHLNPETEAFRDAFTELLRLAQYGLVGANADPVVAAYTLAEFKDRLVTALGPALKMKYLSALRLRAGIVATVCVVLAIGLLLLPIQWSKTQAPAESFAINFCLMIAGSMVGLWISFAARRGFSFEELFLPEDDLLTPYDRVVFVMVCTGLLALMCSEKIAGVSMGAFSTENIPTDWHAALLFGGLSGVGERFLGNAILPRARRMMEALGRAPSH